MPSSGDDKLISWNASYYFGVHSQNEDGKSYIGVSLPLGEITCDQLLELADISEKYGDRKIRTTLSQNLIITGISDEDVPSLLKKMYLNNFLQIQVFLQDTQFLARVKNSVI